MKIVYNIPELPKRGNRGMKMSEEVQALIKLLNDDNNKNMCLKYDDIDQAKKKHTNIRGYISRHKLQDKFESYRIESNIYVVKKS